MHPTAEKSSAASSPIPVLYLWEARQLQGNLNDVIVRALWCEDVVGYSSFQLCLGVKLTLDLFEFVKKVIELGKNDAICEICCSLEALFPN